MPYFHIRKNKACILEPHLYPESRKFVNITTVDMLTKMGAPTLVMTWFIGPICLYPMFSDQIWLAHCFKQPLTYSYFTILCFDFYGKMPKVISDKGSFHSYKTEL